MLTGEYNYLIDNMLIAQLLGFLLLTIPIVLLFLNIKWTIAYYVISIVSNLPLIFAIAFGMSYELIIVLLLGLKLLKEIIDKRMFHYILDRNSLIIIIALVILMIINIVTSLFNINVSAILNRLIIYIVNLFIIFIFTYFIIKKEDERFIINSMLIGAILLIISQLVELFYGYSLGYRNLRPAGLLLDPNVLAFALNIVLAFSFRVQGNKNFFSMMFIIATRVLIVFGVFLTISRSGYIGTAAILIMVSMYNIFISKRWYVLLTTIFVLIIMYFIFQNQINDFLNGIYNIIDLKRVWTKPPTQTIPTPGNGGGDVIVDPGYSNSRIHLLIAGLKIIKTHFWIGVGIGNVEAHMAELTNLELSTHNMILQLIVESGFIMIFSLLFFGYAIINYIYHNKRNRMFFIFIFIIVLLETFFNHNIMNLNITYLGLSIMLGIGVITSKKKIDLSIVLKNR